MLKANQQQHLVTPAIELHSSSVSSRLDFTWN